MVNILKANVNHVESLVAIGTKTFIESHQKSASKEDLESYISKSYSKENVLAEIINPKNEYYVVLIDSILVGYSKLILNLNPVGQRFNSVSKLERIYLLKEYYGKKIGLDLMLFNIELARKMKQKAIWLNVWTENHRAIEFYKKVGFTINGITEFRISENHFNPNYTMLLTL